MKTAVVALTKKGTELAVKLGRELGAEVYSKNELIYVSEKNSGCLSIGWQASSFGSLVDELFHSCDAIVFVMACGIVVRSIAAHIKDKRSDPAVVVMDEGGNFAISLLSGHIGGANKLAGKVALITGGVPVITTATDINGVTAFDVFASENDCAIENIQDLKHISSELVNGGKVSLYTDCDIKGELPANIELWQEGEKLPAAVVLSNKKKVPAEGGKVLYLRPKNLILGIGCKKGKSRLEIEAAVMDFLERNNRSLLSVRCIASIDLKAEEPGIVEFCGARGIPFVTYPAEKIMEIEDRFSSSEFVRKVTGVGNVSEACAVLAGNGGLVCGKTVYPGITLALAEERRTYSLEEGRNV